MPTFHLLPVLVALSLALSTVADLFARDARDMGPGAGYVKLPVQARQIRKPLGKRQSGFPVSTEVLEWMTFVNVTIGSDNQTVPLVFDTGSAFVSVNPDCSQASTEQKKASCSALPRYDPFTSKTAKILDKSFNVTYGFGGVLGTYFSDDFAIGGAMAMNQPFGVIAASSGPDSGVLGAGRNPNGSALSPIENLALQGRINSFAFSVDLRSPTEIGGVILGGLDTKKYRCGITKMDSHGFSSFLTNFSLTLPNKTSITLDTSWKGNNTPGLPVFFDTGSYAGLLPGSLFNGIVETYPDVVNHTNPDGSFNYSVPCDAPLGTFDYSFAGSNQKNVTIRVPFQDSLIQNADGSCTFGIEPHPDDMGFFVPYILGDIFMRGAYIVFDVDNDEIWMGESTDCGSNIVPIGKGKDAVPIIPGCGCEAEATSTGYVPFPGPTFK